MRIFEVTLRIESENEGVDEGDVRRELYDACDQVPFSLDITSVKPGLLDIWSAYTLAERAHAGQTDKIGVPYVEHVRAVAAGLESFGPDLQMAGLLHDVIEDTEWTADQLIKAGVPERVVAIVEKVTNVPGVTYREKIAQVAQNYEATLVKIADNAHNSRADRAAHLSEVDRSRLAEKYRKARNILWNAVSAEDVETIVSIVNPALLSER